MKKFLMAFFVILAYIVNFSAVCNVQSAEKKQYEFVTPCQWEYIFVEPDSNGIYYAREWWIYMDDGKKTGQYHYLFDRYGKLIYKSLNDSVSDFSDGLALVHHDGYVAHVVNEEWEKRAKYFYIDMAGNVALPMIYTRATEFDNGHAIVQMYNEEADQLECFRINTKGERTLLPGDWDTVIKRYGSGNDDFDNSDYSYVRQKDGYDDFDFVIDVNGNRMGKLNYNGICINEEKNLVFIKADMFGKVKAFDLPINFVDFDKYKFEFDKPSEGYIIAQERETKKYGMFDKNFNIVIPFEWDNITGMSEGLIAAGKDGKAGYIDIGGNVIVDFDFELSRPFCDGRAVVGIGRHYGVIRLEDDGRLYDFKENILGTAYNSTVYINGNEEHAYGVDGVTYIDVRLLGNYGLYIREELNGKKLYLTKRLSKIPYEKNYTFEYQDSYNIYDSIGSVYLNGTLVESKDIDGNMSVDIRLIPMLDAAVEGNQIIINSPYEELEGITWEWLTEPLEDVATDSSNGYYYIRNGEEIIYFKDDIMLDKKPEDWVKPEEYPKLVNEGQRLKSGPNSQVSGPYSLGTYKYYDEEGNLVLDDGWTVANKFEDGYASVNYGAVIMFGMGYDRGLWGVIDKDGNYMTEVKWDNVKMFSDKRMLAYSPEKRGLLDKDENELITFTEDDKALKDCDGNIIISADNIRIDSYYPDDECLIVDVNGKEGVIRADGEIVFPFLFYPVIHFGKNIYHVNWDGLIQIKEPDYLAGAVYYNGQEINFLKRPLIVNDRTMIPVRELFEEMGFRVTWYDDTKAAVIENSDRLICLFDGKNGFYSNDVLMYSDTAVINYKDSIYLPLRAVAEAIDCQVSYDGNVYIY